ncbi:TPA: NAD(P)H-dependent glycerol-3-phosphate dehydrogenase [Haemophilus influenzae]|uniref:NAD(P)H-dependent glycerol-3-phosphate dehydrogenase n=1 Tax=Haemophilus influenzae TaxID=727 RepID=UPI0008DBA86A|nr:NAD(P)H-dependent glycerol-3-phosphate dehydrogenase [Haemophilus influenzae]AOZ67254.1 glycerol-3-phosphate dehydrogenase [Haemophilus influenzae]MBD3608677.1 NAD(P)H-dependent glycerol-3-phosphate dehydrogenase [Haemophilus influenzae]NKB85608.1 NAD(P)H-dependent glycerol-3-phosphate dehydrogenase [Haemophilus influenzae]POP28554.1 NAD(P)H-dependent glycerol-3-phosphate dehydrogenase [Haemophilus influenzae]RDT71320.1 NAD(P)H-dependent glycerol-3-phosphate dehydrogenase [Haemophilus influ
MITSQTPITVLGAGSYGTALAITFSRNGSPTHLWGHNPAHIAQMQTERQNYRFLPDVIFPEDLHLESNLAQAMEYSQDILIVVPSHAFGEILIKIKPHLKAHHRLIWATKGLERNTGRLLQTVVEEQLGTQYPLAVLSGPTFAKELAQGLPSAITLAANNEQFAREFQSRIHCSKGFRVYINSDMTGVQLGGAIKNVIAIGAGISDGMGFGANARTALITRGIAEITRLGISLGANTNTFMGMSGLGDLVLTCTDNQSRNRRFGLMLGKGLDAQMAMENIGQVVEGFYNTKEAYLLAQRQGVEMPITEQIYQMLFCGKNAQDVAISLLGRACKGE